MFGFGKKKQQPNGTYGRSEPARIGSDFADKVRLAKNLHKYYGIVPWGMSFLYEEEGQPLREARWMIRNMEEQNAFVSAILSKAATNVTGPHGFKVQPNTGNAELNRSIEKLWAEEFGESGDSIGNDWVTHQELQIRAVFRDGDCGCVNFWSLPNPDTGEPYGIDSLVPFEATDLMTPPNYQPHDAGSRIVDGIEYNALGKPTYFYIRTMSGLGPIPAEHVAYFRNMQKTSNSRGIPALMPGIGLLENLNGLIEAEVFASRLNATTLYHQHHAKAPRNTNPNQSSPGVVPPTPGEVVHTYGDDTFEVMASNHPNPNFKEGVILFARFACLPLFLPLEQILAYFGETNYSSGRASLLEMQRNFERFQDKFSLQYLRKIYRWKILQWVEQGRLVIPAGADVGRIYKHRFIGPKFPYYDPSKELQSDQMKIDIGQETIRSMLAARGVLLEDWLDEREAEIAECRRRGIPIMHHSSFVPLDAVPGKTPPNPPNPPANLDEEKEEDEE